MACFRTWRTSRSCRSRTDSREYEAHRPYPEIHDDVVLHAEQAMVYERLLAGENVVLSAPTSFGKSLVNRRCARGAGFSKRGHSRADYRTYG